MNKTMMLVTEQEITEIKEFILQLNTTTKNVPVIVEDKRDSKALRNLGYSGQILEFHRFGGMVKFVDFVSRYKRIIILFDNDRKGKQITRKSIEMLQRRTKVDLHYKRKLCKITKNKVRFIEQLVCYEFF